MAVLVEVFRKQKDGRAPVRVGAFDVPLPRGASQTSDVARAAARLVAATRGVVTLAAVTVSHAVGGGFVAYLPA